jgi:DNA polymerase (family X)
MTLNEWGLYKLSGLRQGREKTGEPPAAKPVASRTEEEIYTALGLATPDPLLREDRGEIEAATAGKLAALVELRTFTAICTLTPPPPTGTIPSWRWPRRPSARLRIPRHHRSLQESGHRQWTDAERLLAHVKEIHRIGEQIKGITLLAGCEVDILADGRLDFEDDVLAELDIVVASPHVALRQEEPRPPTACCGRSTIAT